MFIANLDEHLTEKDLYDYLFDEGGQRIVQQLKIFRLNIIRKRESAFKLICPEVLYDEIMNLWEEGVTVRDFYYTPRAIFTETWFFYKLYCEMDLILFSLFLHVNKVFLYIFFCPSKY
ncbi:hypothetical protein ACFFRR_005468 [Megaselia abdita]